MLANPKIDQILKFRENATKRRTPIHDQYASLGFISSGTYGNVFKAQCDKKVYAIKKFKPEKEGIHAFSSGISQSACREISLCRELEHENIVFLEQVVLDALDRSIAMVFEYAEHDLLQILHHHSQQERKPIPEYSIKSFIYQILQGISYMHQNWVMHRDLKPANIMVTVDGVVKVGDLGLARIFQSPLQPLYNGDKVVVTIWYRAPELLLEIDIWAIACIFAELLMLKPLFKGEELKIDAKTNKVPFQKDQVSKIFDALGYPSESQWPSLVYMPDYPLIRNLKTSSTSKLRKIYDSMPYSKNENGFRFLEALLKYDPETRISATNALNHPYFQDKPVPGKNAFICYPNKNPWFQYPQRRLQDEKKLK